MGCKINSIKPTETWVKEEKALQEFIEANNLSLSPAELRIQLSRIDINHLKKIQRDLEEYTQEDLGLTDELYAIASNLDSVQDLLGMAQRDINLYLNDRGLSIATLRYLNEGMVTSLLNALTTTLPKDVYTEGLDGSPAELDAQYLEYLNNRNDFQMHISELLTQGVDPNIFYRKIAAAYGAPGVAGTVYSAIEDNFNAVYNQKLEEWQNAEEGSFAKEVLNEELGNLDLWLDEGGLLETLWPSLVKSNVQFLERLGIALDNEFITQQQENLYEQEQDESDQDTVISRDSLGIRPSNEVNPLTRIKPSLKLLLKTLPQSRLDGTPITNKLGMPKLADFGQTMSILYSALSNTNNNWSKIQALKDLATQNITFAVLEDRLGLSEVQEPSDLETLNKDQFDLYTSFMTAFNNAQDAYSFMNVTQDGNRTMVDSNAESTRSLVKLKWGENFKYNIQQRKDLGEVKGGKTIVNLDYKFKGTPLRDLLESKLDINQKMDILEVLGMKFTDREAAQALIEYDTELLDSIGWIFRSIAQDRNISNLMKSDETKNINNLVQVQLDTDLSSGTLQFNSITGRKKYAITLKGFINVLADNLNEDFNEFTSAFGNTFNSPTFLNSQYIEKLRAGEKIEIGVIDGVRNDQKSRGREISSTGKANIALLHVGSILQGAVPLIRTGNKKLERTIKVGDPDYSRGIVRMQQQMLGYLESEIRAAHHIQSKNITDIKGLNSELQYFAHPAFSDIYAKATKLINDKALNEEEFGAFLNSPEVSASILKYLNDTIQGTKALLTKYNIVQNKPSGIRNIGLDPNTIIKIAESKLDEAGLANLETSLAKGIIPSDIYEAIAQQITFIREEGVIEQFKLLLGHPSVYGDLFKRTSGLVSPKKYPDSSEATMRLLDEHYPNQQDSHRRTVRFITRKEVTEDSEYIEKYKEHLRTLGRPDLIDIIDKTYKNMEVFDGGGLVHIDFYRKVRVLTDSWNDALENVYQKIINNEDIGLNELVMLSPLKPQVLAAIDHKGIDIRMFNKFALFPIHPNLSKLVTDRREGNTNVLDSLYNDLVANDLDYSVFESGTKTGAKLNGKGQFEEFVDEEGNYTAIEDESAIQTYDLKYFGVQQDPKDTRGGAVPAGTQSGSMLPTNIFENGVISEEYAPTEFSETESWEEAVNRYHNLTSTLIERDMTRLARELGFKRTPSNDFELIDPTYSKESMKQSIIREMDKRDLPLNTKTAIIDLFDSAGSNHINQLYEKSKIETILNALVTNTVIRREMNGEQVVLQSNLGMKIQSPAIKQKDSSVVLDRKLKFYDIDETSGKTTAMQVYLPHYFKKELGDQFDIKQASKEALTLIGFRIPTEGLNSIDFIEVVGFLPPEAGSTIIVPSEMVAKTGADFDIDKLTLYLPNTEVTDNNVDLVKEFVPREDGTLSKEDLKRLRELDPDVYSNIITEMLPAATAQLRLQQLRTGEQLEELDADLAEYDLTPLGVSMGGGIDMTAIQPRQVLQNELMRFIQDVLEHPSSFAQLMTPVGALDLETRAEEIHEIQNPGYKTEKTLGEEVSFENIIDTTYNMYQTLGGTGVVATSMTHNIKAQRAGLQWNPESVEFNFMGIDPNSISLSRSRDIAGGFINASMQKYISAYVDGEKNPFAMYVNAGKDTAAIHMALLRIGVPLNTVLSFMSQPIIHEYIKAKNELQSEAMNSDQYTYQPELAIINKYGGETMEQVQFFTEDQLNEMLGKSFEELSPSEKGKQVQILQDMLRYKEYAMDLLDLQQISSYDTTKLKNGNEVIYLKALEEKVADKGMFLNSEGLIENSFLKPLRDTFMNTKTLLANVDLKNSSDIIHRKYIELAKQLMQADRSKDDIIYTLNQFDNFLSAYIILQEYSGFTTLAEQIEPMVRGPQSLPRRLKQESSELDNLAIDNLLPILDEYADDNHDAQIDSIRLIGKKYDVEDLNDMVEEMSILKQENPSLYDELIKFSLVQSGLSYGPYTFASILPSKDVLELTSPGYTNFMSKVSLHGFDQAYFEKAFNSFMSNSWNNPRIVPQRYTNKQNLIKHLNKDIIPISKVPAFIARQVLVNPYITIVHHKNQEDGTYYYDMFRLEGDNLVRHEKRGIKNRFIETHGNSIPSNSIKRVRKMLVLGTENMEKIHRGDKTNHLITRGMTINTSGEYKLPDGSVVELDIKDINRKTLTANTTAGKRLRDFLDVSHKNPIFAFANSLGFKDIDGFKKSYPNFFKGNSMDVATIKVITRGTMDLSDDVKGTAQEGSTTSLSNAVKGKYNKINKEC